ncbi:MAG: hypothetical protein HYZ75_18850 [Elusimicrobia bacterium]|nr:hypothetical protein [Elusimicrobiota bacterium]
MNKKPTLALPLLVGSSALALYLSLPSLGHNFDGVACAIAVELGDFKHLVHGNHLAYGLAGFVFHRLVNALGLALPAIWALQVMDSLLGALSAALFARMLLRLGRPAGVAAAAGMGLAVSYGWWLRSVDAQVYLLAAPFMVLAFEEVLAERPRPLRLAALHTAAMLVHSVHVCFTPVALWALLRAGKDYGESRAGLGRYLAFCFLGVLAAYAAAVTLLVRPETVEDLRVWLSGSAALGNQRDFRFIHAASLGSALAWWGRVSLKVVSIRPLLGLPLWGLAAWGWLAGASRRERVAALVWVAGYAPLLLAYEPWNTDYRILELIPLWALAAAAFSPERARGGARALAFYAAALGAVNAADAILPLSRLAENPPLVKTLWLRRILPEDAWVSAAAIDEVYIPYFSHRRTLNLRWHEGDPAGLRRRLDGLLERGEPVFVTSDHLAGWREAFGGYELQHAGEQDGVVLYRLKGKPKGSL